MLSNRKEVVATGVAEISEAMADPEVKTIVQFYFCKECNYEYTEYTYTKPLMIQMSLPIDYLPY